MAGSLPISTELRAYPPGWNWAACLTLSLLCGMAWRVLGRTLCRWSYLQRLTAAAPSARNRAKFPKNASALVHSVQSTLVGLVYFPLYFVCSDNDRYNCSSLWHSHSILWPCAFAGYLLQDMAEDVRLHRAKLVPLPWDMIAHHCVFLGVLLLQLVYEKGCFVYTWLIMGEGSTIPLLIRWFAIAVQAPQSLIGKLNLVFFLSFVLLRVIVYGIGLLYFIRDDHHVFRTGFLLSPYQLTPLLVAGGYVLNLAWAQQMLTVVFKERRERFAKQA